MSGSQPINLQRMPHRAQTCYAPKRAHIFEKEQKMLPQRSLPISLLSVSIEAWFGLANVTELLPPEHTAQVGREEGASFSWAQTF